MAITRSMKKNGKITDTHCLEDIISSLPENILETFLCLVPIQEAARTSILSKDWRYIWTKFPKLVFDDDTFQVSSDDVHLSESELMAKRRTFFNAINEVILRHQGPISEFTLSTRADNTCVEINQIMLTLSRLNTVKKLRLHLDEFGLPSSVFSWHQLTDYLDEFEIFRQPTFDRFSSITTLYLDRVYLSTETLLHILSNCPLLKNFTPFLDTDNVTSTATLIELFDCLPSIERLSTWFWIIECFVQYNDVFPRKLPISLVHLKYLSLEDKVFFDKYGLSFLALLMTSSPNLEKLKLHMFPEKYHDEIFPEKYRDDVDFDMLVTTDDYSNIWLEHLNELEIEEFQNSKHEVEFVKFILAKSPMLKKVKIFLSNVVNKDEEILMLRILSHSPHASPVEIFVQSPYF